MVKKDYSDPSINDQIKNASTAKKACAIYEAAIKSHARASDKTKNRWLKTLSRHWGLKDAPTPGKKSGRKRSGTTDKSSKTSAIA